MVNSISAARSLSEQLHVLFRYREMLFLWTRRELQGHYRQSVFGFGWVLIQPVFQIIVISAIFGGFVKVPSDGLPYPVFVYAGLLPWILFASSVGSAVPSILGNRQLVTKIYFPREILPLSAILTRTVDFGIGSVVFAALMIWYEIPAYPTLLYLPLLIVIQTFLALGISLLGASLSVFVRDVSFVLPFVMQLWMYASPVIYPVSLVPERWRNLYMLNPMAGIIDSYRRVVLWGESPNLGYLGMATALALGFSVLGYSYFKKLEMSMSDAL